MVKKSCHKCVPKKHHDEGHVEVSKKLIYLSQEKDCDVKAAWSIKITNNTCNSITLLSVVDPLLLIQDDKVEKGVAGTAGFKSQSSDNSSVIDGGEVVGLTDGISIEPSSCAQVVLSFSFENLHVLNVCNSATVTWQQKDGCDNVETKKVTVVSKPLEVDNKDLLPTINVSGTNNVVNVGDDNDGNVGAGEGGDA